MKKLLLFLCIVILFAFKTNTTLNAPSLRTCQSYYGYCTDQKVVIIDTYPFDEITGMPETIVGEFDNCTLTYSVLGDDVSVFSGSTLITSGNKWYEWCDSADIPYQIYADFVNDFDSNICH